MILSRIPGGRRLLFAVYAGMFVLLCSCRTLITVGAVETVLLEDFDITTEARIDTGAALCSLGVDSVIPSADGEALFFMYDGKRYCCSRARTVAVRTVNGTVLRPTVELTARIGNRKKRCEWTLSDRSGMQYAALVGRNWLSGTALVDVSAGKRPNGKQDFLNRIEEESSCR